MKKFIAIFLALVVMLSFAACGNDKVENADGDEVTTADKKTDTEDTKPVKDSVADTTESGYSEIKEGETYTCEVCGTIMEAKDVCVFTDGIWKTYMCADCYNAETAE